MIDTSYMSRYTSITYHTVTHDICMHILYVYTYAWRDVDKTCRLICSIIYIWIRYIVLHIRPTQSIMYVPLQVNTSQKCILLIVQYKYIKSCSRDFYSPESDPPHKIMRYWVFYSTHLSFGFPPDRICQVEMICISGVAVLKRHFGGAGP